MALLPAPGPRLYFTEFDDPEDVLTEYRWFRLAPTRVTRRPLPPDDEELALERGDWPTTDGWSWQLQRHCPALAQPTFSA